MVAVRVADLDTDARPILEAAQDFIFRSDLAEFMPQTDEALGAALARVLSLDYVEVLLAETDRVVGALGLLYAPYLWNPELLNAEELFWWVAEDAPKTAAMRLIRAARHHAKDRGAEMMAFRSLTTSPPGLEKVYRGLRLRPIETAWMGMIP